MKLCRLLLLVGFSMVLLTLGAQRRVHALPTITDVSWPNCSTRTPTPRTAGIVGVTNGLDFTTNPCTTTEANWFSSYSLYMNTGYPGKAYGLRYPNSPRACLPTQSYCLAYNYGFNAAKYALTSASQANVHSFQWWLDVETINSWTPYPATNQAALVGMVAAIQHTVPFSTTGFYSAPAQWQTIVGSWRPSAPAWIASGGDSPTAAIAACSESSFTRQAIRLAQYTSGLDQNIPCAALSRRVTGNF
jgi:hypothetical protein